MHSLLHNPLTQTVTSTNDAELYMYAEAAVSSVSLELVRQLEVLMVEGDLLQVDADEQQSLQLILAACDSSNYGFRVFQFEVRALWRLDTTLCHIKK